jgi:hypothetical protein
MPMTAEDCYVGAAECDIAQAWPSGSRSRSSIGSLPSSGDIWQAKSSGSRRCGRKTGRTQHFRVGAAP